VIAPAVLCHGGAGKIAPERHAAVTAAVERAAAIGRARLAAGARALDVVEAVVRVLEDDPELNAGTGSALTRDQTVEVDASIMDGATRRVGAVAAVPDLADAIRLARAVLDDGEHVILAGPAAWRFARPRGFAPAAPGALVTERALARWREEHTKRGSARETDGGTVGAVAIDARAHLAAATSTGGVAYKRSGRVGDSPVPGAGTWADDHAAVSATGDGEHILRVALARGVAAQIAAGVAVERAIAAGLDELTRVTGATAGLIVIDRGGRFGAGMSSETMPIGWARGDGDVHAIVAPPAGWTL
jgi:beta-aspartyl-peptidase (threonine type)